MKNHWRTHRYSLVMAFLIAIILAGGGMFLNGCSHHPPLNAVDNVDLERYMGDWYVIAFIPIFAEKHATNAIEHYELVDSTEVAITYTFYKHSPDGEFKEYTARGFVQDDTGDARWKVQFFWPLKFPYIVIDLADDYSYTVIGVPNRNYLWIMAREPQIAPDVYEGIVQRVKDQGYDITQIREAPQQWDTTAESNQGGE